MSNSTNKGQIYEKTIEEIYDKKIPFFVPSYQRGYRWTTTQMKELVTDLYMFFNNIENEKKYYCIQPIIVKKDEKGSIIVDGQQRLTAIWLILAVLKSHTHPVPVIKEDPIGFSINYEKKIALMNLINAIDNNITSTKRINGVGTDEIEEIIGDYKSKSVDCLNIIENLLWLVNREETYGNKFICQLLEVIGENLHRIKVIWYELDESDDPIKTFANINANKIKLTNSELLKAVIINKMPTDKKTNTAIAWESLENGLQDDKIWCFMNNQTKGKKKVIQYSTRLDYLFEIYCNNCGIVLDADDQYAVFHAINNQILDEERNAETIWEEILSIYGTLLDWYENYQWYHMIGTIIALNLDRKELLSDATIIKELMKKYMESGKKDFTDYLIEKLTKKYYESVGQDNKDSNLKGKEPKDIIDELKSIKYGSDANNRDRVTNVLLLYNIAILINEDNPYQRFPFDLYAQQYWDIEHVNPQTPSDASDEEKKAWADSYLQFFKEITELPDLTNVFPDYVNETKANNEELKEKVTDIEKNLNEFKKDPKNNIDTLIRIEGQLNELLDKAPQDNDNIQNLVLLDRGTNRSYKNDCFSMKRNKIIEAERNLHKNPEEKSVFILPGTKWLFLKGFDGAKGLYVWGKSDTEAYKEEIAKNIIKMLGGTIDV